MTDSTKWDPAYDGAAAAPKSHAVIFEDENIRVLSVTMEPLAKEPEHHHKWPSRFILMRSTNLLYTDENGKTSKIAKREVSPDKPYIEELEPEGLHSVENLDDEPYLAIRVEFKT